ncbi:MAG: molybdopterin cofactor-binding domain-containing protein [Pseudolabrys sp.]
MNAPHSRRAFLAGTGALVIAFSMRDAFAQGVMPAPGVAPAAKPSPGDLSKYPRLDSWIRLEANGHVTVFAGKAELGTGVKTAFIQCAAEELDLSASSITMITADTALTTDEGYTAGSHSMQDCGTAIRYAAADLHATLIELAAARLSVNATDLKSANGVITAPDARKVSYGELVDGLDQHRDFRAETRIKPSSALAVMGKPFDRVDIPGKLTGGEMYVQGHAARRHVALRAWYDRPATAPGSQVSIPPRSKNCPASSRSFATAASSRSSPSVRSRPFSPCMSWKMSRAGDDQTKLPKQSDTQGGAAGAAA